MDSSEPTAGGVISFLWIKTKAILVPRPFKAARTAWTRAAHSCFLSFQSAEFHSKNKKIVKPKYSNSYQSSFLKLMKSPTQINENNCHRRHLIQMLRHPICFDNSFWNKPFVRCSSGFWWFGKIISWIFNKEPPWKKSYIFFKLFFHEIKNISCINMYIILYYFQYRK